MSSRKLLQRFQRGTLRKSRDFRVIFQAIAFEIRQFSRFALEKRQSLENLPLEAVLLLGFPKKLQKTRSNRRRQRVSGEIQGFALEPFREKRQKRAFSWQTHGFFEENALAA